MVKCHIGLKRHEAELMTEFQFCLNLSFNSWKLGPTPGHMWGGLGVKRLRGV